MSRQKEIIRQSGVYSASTLLTQVITVTAAFLTRKFLGPTQMGVWSTLQILVDYSKYAVLGTMSAVTMEIPYSIGRGEPEKADQIKNTAFTFVVISTLVFSSAVAIFAFMTQGRFPQEVTYGLYFVSAIIFLQRISNLLIALLRCYKKFHIESGQMIWSSIVNAILIAFLAARFRIYGFICALGLSFVFNIFYLLKKHRYDFKWRFDKKIFQPLVVRGFPLMLFGLMNTGFQNIDRMVIAKWLDFELLGIYSIALMTCSFIGNFLNAANAVLTPHFQEKFGEKNNPNDLQDFLFKSALPLALIMPILICASWIFVPYLIRFFLPKFTPGITSMKLLVLSVFFAALTHTYQISLMTIKKHAPLFFALGISTLVAAGLGWLAIHCQKGIEGVAVVVTLSSGLNFSLTYFFATRHFSDAKKNIKRYFILMAFFAGLILFIFAENWLIPLFARGILRFCLESLLAAIFCAPLLFMLNKRFSFFKLFLGKFAPKKIAA